MCALHIYLLSISPALYGRGSRVVVCRRLTCLAVSGPLQQRWMYPHIHLYTLVYISAGGVGCSNADACVVHATPGSQSTFHTLPLSCSAVPIVGLQDCPARGSQGVSRRLVQGSSLAVLCCRPRGSQSNQLLQLLLPDWAWAATDQQPVFVLPSAAHCHPVKIAQFTAVLSRPAAQLCSVCHVEPMLSFFGLAVD
jgi:hypothetical protein